MEIGTTEAADRLDISPGRVRQLIDKGLLPARKGIGDNWLIQVSDLSAARKRRTQRGRPKKAKPAKANGK